MLMYGKEASNWKQQIYRQQPTIPEASNWKQQIDRQQPTIPYFS